MRLPTPLAHLLALALLPMVCLAQARPAPSDNRIAKLYDIGDLVTEVGVTDVDGKPAKQFKAPKLGLTAAKPLETTIGAEAVGQLLRAFIKPKLRSNEEVTCIGERWIVALGRPEQHAWIARFLEAARDNDSQAVLIGCKCFSIPEITFLQRIRPALVAGPDDTPDAEPSELPEDAPNYLTQVLAPGERTTAFLRELEKNAEVEVVAFQEIHVLPLRTAHVSVLNQTAYIRDFDIQVALNSIIANPIVDVVRDGMVMQVAVSPLETDLLGVSLDARVTKLQRPIPQFETKLPGIGQPLTIQLPSLQSTHLEAAVELKANDIIVMAPPPLAGMRMMFVVTVVPQKAVPQKR